MRTRHAKLTALLFAAALLGARRPRRRRAASPPSSETVFFEAPRDLLGVTGAQQQATLAKLQSLGVHALRIVLYWGDVAPSPKHKKRPALQPGQPRPPTTGAPTTR